MGPWETPSDVQVTVKKDQSCIRPFASSQVLLKFILQNAAFENGPDEIRTLDLPCEGSWFSSIEGLVGPFR